MARQKPKQTTLKLKHPNGGELFLAGNDTAISWEGVSASELVNLKFSNNNGKGWNQIANNTSNLSHKWSNISKVASNECLIKVEQRDSFIDSNKITSTKVNDNSSAISILWSPDGNRLAVSSENQTCKIWDKYSGNLLMNIKEAGYDKNISWSPDGSNIVTLNKKNIIKIWDSF